jgi:hypothetical protein
MMSYRRAVSDLEKLRLETRAQYGSAEQRFRRAVAPVYLDLIEVLLMSCRKAFQLKSCAGSGGWT